MKASELAEHLRAFTRRYGDRDVITRSYTESHRIIAVTFDATEPDPAEPFTLLEIPD